MSVHTLSAKIARTLRDVDAARTRAAASHTSCATLAAMSRVPEGKPLPVAPPVQREERTALRV
jgi:hypothetical protein